MATPAAAATVELVVRSGTTVDGIAISQLFQRPDVNNAGQVAYAAFTSSGTSGGIFTRDGLLVGPGDNVAGNTFSRPFGVHPVINNAGTVMFGMVTSGNQVLLATPSAAVFNYTTQQVSGQSFQSIGQHALNDAGGVVMYGGFASMSGRPAIANTSSILVKEGDVIDGFTINTSSIFNVSEAGHNAAGTFVFRAASGSGTHLFTLTDRLVGTGSSVAGRTLTDVNGDAAINDLGQVAYGGFFPGALGRGVFTLDRAVVVAGDTVDGRVLNTFDSNVDINELGQVAYRANYVGGGSGIFLEQDLAISTGDVIAGGLTVASLGRPALNDVGQIATYATFTDGTSGILLVTVPEPSGALVAGVVAAGAGLTRVRRRRRR